MLKLIKHSADADADDQGGDDQDEDADQADQGNEGKDHKDHKNHKDRGHHNFGHEGMHHRPEQGLTLAPAPPSSCGPGCSVNTGGSRDYFFGFDCSSARTLAMSLSVLARICVKLSPMAMYLPATAIVGTPLT